MAFKFPPLPDGVPLVGKDGSASRTFARFWQKLGKAVETQETTQDTILADLAQAQVDIVAALELAGIAVDLANSIMPDIPPVTISADYTGTVLTGQLPRNVSAARFDDETDVTASSAWSATTISGDATYTIGAADGILNITAITATTVIEITSVYNSITRSRRVTVYKTLQDPPPSSGAGTGSAYDSSILETSAITYGAANAGPLTLTCGASGEVDLAAPLTTSVIELDAAPGSYGAFGKWQYRPSGGGAWTDVDTEVASSTSATLSPSGVAADGSITVNQSQTGLTASSDYEFQLLLRSTNANGTLYYTGSASATTS